MRFQSIGSPEPFGASAATGFFPETITGKVTLDTGAPTVDKGDILVFVKGALIEDGQPGTVKGALALVDDMEAPINGRICVVALEGGVAGDEIEVCIQGVCQMDTAAADPGDLIVVPDAAAVAGVIATGSTGKKVIGLVLSDQSPYGDTTPLVYFDGFGFGYDIAAIAAA